LTLSESDADEEFFTNKRSKHSKKHRRHLKDVAEGLVPPTQAHQRFSTRQRVSIANYTETTDNEFEEEDSVTPNYWANAPEDDSPFIGQVLAHEILDNRSYADDELDKQHFRYWIRWEGQSHYHATWESYQDLKNNRGNRKIDNYFKKIIIPFIDQEQGDATAEDKELLKMQYQLKVDEYLEHQKVERVIGMREGNDGTQYLVKWLNLTYDGATWESESLVSELSQEEIDGFLNRSQHIPSSDKKLAWTSNHKQPDSYVRTQPSYIKNGKLRDFQLWGLNYMALNWCRRKNVILADEMGLGKTVQTVSFISWMVNAMKQAGPFLCIVPLSTLPAWMETFKYWAPDLNVISYIGNSTSRQIIGEHELLVDGDPRRTKFHVVVSTYEIVMVEKTFLQSIKWKFLAVDEAHRLKNRDAQLYEILTSFNIPCKLLITGTPMQNTVGELSALLDFLNPGVVDAPQNLDNLSIDKMNEEERNAAAKQLAEFKDAIRPFILRRIKEEVEKDLPPKTEKIIRVALSKKQQELYQNILTRNYSALTAGSGGHKQSLLNMIMELKKVSNHPFLFSGVERTILGDNPGREERLRGIVTSSSKMMLLDKLLVKLKTDGHRVLIFTQFVMVLDILTEYLNLKSYKHQRLDGAVPSAARRRAIDHFNAPGSEDFVFILSTRAGGLGINLATADSVILFDADWNPHQDVQAMARAHRIGQTRPVQVLRFVSEHTVEEEIIERQRNKLMLESILIRKEIGGKDVETAFHKHAHVTDAPQTAEDISEILKRRSVKIFESNDNQQRLEQLDIDAILEKAEDHVTKDVSGIKSSDGGFDFMQAMITNVKFDGTWDQIIPQEKLEAIAEEERKREEAEFLEQMQEENQPRKRKQPASGLDKDQREAKRRAKKTSAAIVAAQDDDSDDDRKSNSGDESDHNRDPKRPLSSKDWRNLIRACEKYGAFNDYDAQQKIIKEARLAGRDLEVLQHAYNEVVHTCNKKIIEAKVQAVEDERLGKKALTKKEKKAILAELHGVKRINCETFLERASDMHMIRELVSNASDIKAFRIKDANKPATYSCEWGTREDGMLIVGMARHGFGGWSAIKADPELGMEDKFFLEENRAENKKQRAEEKNTKSPGAVHLVRRANYLLSVLRDKVSNGTDPEARKTVENHHRSKKHPRDRVRAKDKLPSASPAVNGGGMPRPIKSEYPKPESNGVAPSMERTSSRESNAPNGLRRRAPEDIDRDSKRRRLSDERERPRNLGSDDRERRDRQPDRRRDSRDRSRSPYRREEYRDRRDDRYSNDRQTQRQPYLDERRQRVHNQDSRQQRDERREYSNRDEYHRSDRRRDSFERPDSRGSNGRTNDHRRDQNGHRRPDQRSSYGDDQRSRVYSARDDNDRRPESRREDADRRPESRREEPERKTPASRFWHGHPAFAGVKAAQSNFANKNMTHDAKLDVFEDALIEMHEVIESEAASDSPLTVDDLW
jgi:chromodomain-helicase-DNA-binding protein 1